MGHLDTFAGDGPDGFVFVGVKGGQLRRSNFSKLRAPGSGHAGVPGGRKGEAAMTAD